MSVQNKVRRVFVGASRAAFNTAYRLSTRATTRGDEVVLLSRQADEPSYDFKEVARAFEERGWRVHMHLKKVSMRHFPGYAAHVAKEIVLLSRCKVAVLDRYDPVVSLIDFQCEAVQAPANGGLQDASATVRLTNTTTDAINPAAVQANAADNAVNPTVNQSSSTGNAPVPTVAHTEYPVEPMVLQLWHAFGAYKKFGYQSVGTREGHSREVTDVFDIHRNYSWVACSGERCREAFAEALSYPLERVVVLDRPARDEIHTLGDQASKTGGTAGSSNRRCRVLMAPTLRKSKASVHPFRDLHEHRERFEAGIDADVVWSFHPLEDGLPAPGNVSSALVDADILVTDYSSIAYEGYLLGKSIVFYIPDIDSYRVSPGLNADPLELCPELCALTERELAEMVGRFASNPDTYPTDALEVFAGYAFDDPSQEPAAERIVDFCIEKCPPPMVSILVPVFNAELYLRECLDSLVDQTLRDIEILCIDDGSTDSSPAILAEYASRDSRIRIITKPNSGYGDSMNKGIHAARGRYIGICEPDDFCDTRMFERLAKAAERHGCDIAKANYCEHSDDSRRDNLMEILHGLPYRVPFSPRDVPQVLLVEPTIWAAVYRREFLLENGIELSPTPGASFQDASFGHQCWTSAASAILLPEGFYHYRVDNAASSSKSGAKVFAICGEYERTFAFLHKRPPADLQLFGPWLNVVRQGNYLWNYNRISAEHHEPFAQRWIADIVAADDEGLLDVNLMTPGYRALLNDLLDGADVFAVRHLGDIPVPPIK